MRYGPCAHFITKNHQTTMPRRFVYLDTEANQTERNGSRIQTLRLGVLAFQQRRSSDDRWSECNYQTAKSHAEIWEAITDVTRAKARTVVVAHNLAYDLRLSGGLKQLSRLGWGMKGIKLDYGHAWAVYMKEKRTLNLVDSMSWIPYPLEDIGEMVGMPKLALPPWNDSDDAWEARCRRDVDILAEAWRRLMDWIAGQDLGMWRPTGAGQGWSAFRHRFMHHDLLVHDDEEAHNAEREAAYTGRCEAWRHGKLSGGPFTEWDYTGAYAAVGRDTEVPVRLLRHHGAMELSTWHDLRCSYRLLSRVRISTEKPILAQRTAHGIIWPIGTLSGLWWDNEVSLALDHGATAEIEEVWVYEMAPALHDFCTWILRLIDRENDDVDQVVKVMLKHWSRSVIGRFGARWSRWADAGSMAHDDCRRWTDLDGETGERREMLQLGRRVMVTTETIDAPDCCPQVMSYVMAESRCRLWRATLAAGQENVAYMDTDSLLTDAAGTARLRAAAIEGLRIKSEARRAEVLGPRQIVLDGSVRASGLPRSARKVGARSFVSDVWRQLDASLKLGESDSVVIATRRQQLRATDRRRVHNPDGTTSPISL